MPFNVLIKRLTRIEEKLFLSRLQVVGDARARNDEDTRLFMEHFNLKRRVAEWCVRAPVLCFRGSEAGRCLLGRIGVV